MERSDPLKKTRKKKNKGNTPQFKLKHTTHASPHSTPPHCTGLHCTALHLTGQHSTAQHSTPLLISYSFLSSFLLIHVFLLSCSCSCSSSCSCSCFLRVLVPVLLALLVLVLNYHRLLFLVFFGLSLSGLFIFFT